MWGCFPRSRPSPAQAGSLPHACGGVSSVGPPPAYHPPSSPRMWGCFCPGIAEHVKAGVFPTHVGVFLWPAQSPHGEFRLPHACGGVSHSELGYRISRVSSPRMWGCFPALRLVYYCHAVFPTHVGVFPQTELAIVLRSSLPHACGGVSEAAGLLGKLCESSPRMWGCFQFIPPSRKNGLVFPTHVGVFPSSSTSRSGAMCLPHACGGVSTADFPAMMMDESSPRMWGCFWNHWRKR